MRKHEIINIILKIIFSMFKFIYLISIKGLFVLIFVAFVF